MCMFSVITRIHKSCADIFALNEAVLYLFDGLYLMLLVSENKLIFISTYDLCELFSAHHFSTWYVV